MSSRDRKRSLFVRGLACFALASSLAVADVTAGKAALPGGSVRVDLKIDDTTVDFHGKVELDRDGPMVTVATDPIADYSQFEQSIPITQDGGDLVGLRLRSLRTGQLLVQWRVSELPETTEGPGLPGLVYVFDFRVDGGPAHVIAAGRVQTAEQRTEPVGWICRETWPDPAPAGPTGCDPWMVVVNRDVPVIFDAAGDTITAVVSPFDIGLAPGSVIRAYRQRNFPDSCGRTANDIGAHLIAGRTCSPPCHGACVSPGDIGIGWPGRIGEVEHSIDGGDPEPLPVTVSTWRDRIAEARIAPYTYGLTVELAAARPRANPLALDYVRGPVPDVNGAKATFEGRARGLRPGQSIFARVCFGGASNCFYGRSRPVPRPDPKRTCLGFPEGNGVIVGTSRSETLVGTRGIDLICGRGGNDRIRGGGGDDVLVGGSGRDSLVGQIGADQLFGGASVDRMYGGAGRDYCLGGAGLDRASACEYIQ